MEYERFADIYGVWTASAPSAQANLRYYVDAYLDAPKGAVVELGVGDGRIAVEAARAGRAVTGVDLSPAMLRLCAARAAETGVGDRITLLQLLNHTSGVKSYTGIAGYMGNPVRRDLSTAELIQEFKNQPVDFAPGEKWAYNNSGYVLLGAVVEAISGKSWHQTLNDLLLQPAGITGVHYEAGDQLFPGMARG